MQQKMKLRQMIPFEIEQLLIEEKVGRIGTFNSRDGFPYVVPVHFVYFNGRIYIHGLDKGQKVDNIRLNSRVCFEIDSMVGLIMHEEACKVSTNFQSVIVNGVARLVEDIEEKKAFLSQIVNKYTPTLSQQVFSEKILAVTSIIEIKIDDCTGKCYK